MADQFDVNPATLDLLKRTIAEEVETRVRKQLFATYALAGTAVLAVLGIVGYSGLAALQQNVVAFVRTEYANVEADRDRSRIMSLEISTLLANYRSSLNDLKEKLSDVGLNTARLDSFKQTVGDLEKRLPELRLELSGETGGNQARIKELSQQIAQLSEQVGLLNRSATEPAAAVTAATLTIATEAEKLGSAIQQQQQKMTIYLQFAAITRDKAQQIAASLSKDFVVPAPERTSNAASLYEIRCFFPSDCQRAADRVAPALAAAVRAGFNDPRSPAIVDLTGWAEGRKPRMGTVEVWYGGPHA